MKRASQISKRIAIACTAFCICSSIAWDSPSAQSDNSVKSLNYSQDSARTLVEIGVQSDPTFSVYSLKNPDRVVVEILDCGSTAGISPIQVRNGVVDTAAVSVSQSNDYSTCRVILGLEKETTYAVDSSKDRITVAIDGMPSMNGAQLADAYQQMKQSRDEALASARAVAEREQASARQAQQEAAAARAEANSARAEALAAAQREQQAAEIARAEAKSARAEADQALAREKAALAQLEKAYHQAQSRVSEIEAQRDEAKLSAQRSNDDISAQLTQAQAELAKAQSNAKALENARNQALARAQSAESQRDLAQASAQKSLEREQMAIAQLQEEQRRSAHNSALANDRLKQSQNEKENLLADLNERTAQARMLSERAEMAQREAQRLMDETRANENARIAEVQQKLAQAEQRVALAAQNSQLAQEKQANAAREDRQILSQKLAASNDELAAARASLAKIQRERDEAMARAQSAESNAQRALVTAQNQKTDANTQLAELTQQLSAANQRAQIAEQNNVQTHQQLAQSNARIAELTAQLDTQRANAQRASAGMNAQNSEANERLSQSNKRIAELTAQLETERANAHRNETANHQANARIAQLESERANALQKANAAERNNALLAAQNADLMQKITAQQSEMARLDKEVRAGGAAREKLKRLEAQKASDDAASAQVAAQRDAEIAELKAQARQGRKSLEKLHQLQAQNAQLQAQLDSSATQLAATTQANASQPATAQIATTAPIDMQIASNPNPQKIDYSAPIDNKAAAMASVRDIQFKNDANGNGMQVVVKLSAPVNKVENIDAGQQKTVLKIANAVLPDNFNKKFDTTAFNQGVRFVDSTQTNSGIELIAQSSSKTVDSIEQNGDTITWNIRPLRDNNVPYKANVDRRNAAMISAAEPNTYDLSNTYGAQKTLKDSPLAKRKITLDIHDADINDLLRLLSDEINTSIVVSPDVKGNVTLSLKSVPLDQALDIILRMHNLGMRYQGNIIWIAKAETFRAEEERALKAAEVRERLEPLEVRLIPVNYASAGDLQANVSSLLSSRGSVNIDTRTNTLILKDVAANLDAAEILVNNLDTQTPQILIEARIVETQANFTKEIGVQWGGDGIASAQTGNATGIVFPSTVGIAGGSTSDNNAGTSATPNFAVNLPASVGTGSGGALGIVLGSVGGAINLNIRLSALENKGFLKIVSAPRIMTLDNIQASIEQGTSIPISVVSAAGAQTVFYDAKLNLQVTPHVTRDGNVYLKIDITKNEPDFGNTGANGDPSIIRKEAHTELLIPDGETTVIGGIYTRNASQSMASVPFFGSIPILGYLFRSTSETDNRTELLIFITPRIINRDASIAASGHGSFIPPVEREDESKK